MALRELSIRALLGSAALALSACSPSSERAEPGAAPDRPSVILLSIDTQRADHLGGFGYPHGTSPAIDALATTSQTFVNAVAQAPWTLPSHASLMTSLYSRTHQTNDRERRLPAELETLAGTLRAAGYRTHAVVSGPFMRSEFGLNEGFETYDDTLAQVDHKESHGMITSSEIHERGVRFLDSTSRPFFLFLHYWDVHYDYIPPAPFDAKFDPDYDGTVTGENFIRNRRIHQNMPPRDLEHVVSLYDGEIASLDTYLGRLAAELERRDLLDDVILIVTADHGDEFFEHGEKGHQHSLYRELLHVPLLVRVPGLGAGLRPERVELIDVMPTVLEALDIEAPGGLQGRSLLPLMRGEGREARPVFSETTKTRKSRAQKARSESWCVYDGNFKLVLFDEDRYPAELYDLSSDPAELENLGRRDPYRELLARYERWAERTPAGMPQPHDGLDEETRSALDALGYVGD